MDVYSLPQGRHYNTINALQSQEALASGGCVGLDTHLPVYSNASQTNGMQVPFTGHTQNAAFKGSVSVSHPDIAQQLQELSVGDVGAHSHNSQHRQGYLREQKPSATQTIRMSCHKPQSFSEGFVESSRDYRDACGLAVGQNMPGARYGLPNPLVPVHSSGTPGIATCKSNLPNGNFQGKGTAGTNPSFSSFTRSIKPVMYPHSFDGKTGFQWSSYKEHFKICASINGWSPNEKAHWLAGSLQGRDANVLVGQRGKWTYDSLLKALDVQLGPSHHPNVHMSALRQRRKKKSESLAELGSSIKELVALAYPDISGGALSRISISAFLDALTNWEMKQFVLSRQPTSIEHAVDIASEWEVFRTTETDSQMLMHIAMDHSGPTVETDVANRLCMLEHKMNQLKTESHSAYKPENDIVSVHSRLLELEEKLKQANKQIEGLLKQVHRKSIKCYNCGGLGHIAKNCKVDKRNGKQENC